MPCYAIDGLRPVVDPTAYVHPTAVLIGDVIVGPGVYIAPLASLRGDFGRIVLKEGANLQDTCVMHGFPGSDTVVEKDGHIGHGAVIHGCQIGENALIGMNAVIMDGAIIGESCIVAASAFVKAGTEIPARHLAAGTPAKVIKELDDKQISWKRKGTAEYQELARRSLRSMVECAPLTEVEADRGRRDVSDETVPLHTLKKPD